VGADPPMLRFQLGLHLLQSLNLTRWQRLSQRRKSRPERMGCERVREVWLSAMKQHRDTPTEQQPLDSMKQHTSYWPCSLRPRPVSRTTPAAHPTKQAVAARARWGLLLRARFCVPSSYAPPPAVGVRHEHTHTHQSITGCTTRARCVGVCRPGMMIDARWLLEAPGLLARDRTGLVAIPLFRTHPLGPTFRAIWRRVCPALAPPARA
jgi:hypothetical protein